MTASRVLEVAYHPDEKWPLSLLARLQGTAVLVSRHAGWAESALSDLAFGVSTRLGYLPDVVQAVDDALSGVGEQLQDRDAVVEGLLRKGYSFSSGDYAPVRRLLFSVCCFITESRACFESLALFYQGFLEIYFGETVSKPLAYQAVEDAAHIPAWGSDLKRIRGALLHERSIWLAFEVKTDARSRYEPLFVLNWRPGHFGPDDCMDLPTLRKIGPGLRLAAVAIEQTLERRVEAITR